MQNSVGAHLQHDGRQHHRAGGGRFHVRVRQPGVQREQRHLDGECHEESQEQQHLLFGTETQLAAGQQVEDLGDS